MYEYLCDRLVLAVERYGSEYLFFFFSSRRRHTRSDRDWSSDVCSSDLVTSYGEEMRNLGKLRTAIIDPGKTRTAMRADA